MIFISWTDTNSLPPLFVYCLNNRTSCASVKNRSSLWLLLMYLGMPLHIIRLEAMSSLTMKFNLRISWPKSMERKRDHWLLSLRPIFKMSIWKRLGLLIICLTVQKHWFHFQFIILECLRVFFLENPFNEMTHMSSYDVAHMIQTQRHIKDSITSTETNIIVVIVVDSDSCCFLFHKRYPQLSSTLSWVKWTRNSTSNNNNFNHSISDTYQLWFPFFISFHFWPLEEQDPWKDQVMIIITSGEKKTTWSCVKTAKDVLTRTEKKEFLVMQSKKKRCTFLSD